MPAAIVYMSQHMNDEIEIERFLKYLERLAAGQMILRANINERINRYARLLTAIEQSTDLYASDSPLLLDKSECQKILAVLNGDLYHESKIRLYVLLRLDSELSKGQASYTYPIITVEHVLPQTPDTNSIWMKWFPTEQQREAYTHKLGNLSLLARKKNGQAQNYDFDVKKKKYFSSSKGISNFALTTQVLNQTEWTPAVVDTRQKQLVDTLKALWNL